MHGLRDVSRRGMPGEGPHIASSTLRQSSGITACSESQMRLPSPPPMSSDADVHVTARISKWRRVSPGTTSLLPAKLLRRLAALPAYLRRELRFRKGTVAVMCAVVLLFLSFTFFDFMCDKILEYSARPATAATAEVWGIEEFDAPSGATSILVQHDGAVARLNVTLQHVCVFQELFCNQIRLSPQLLPSWTLHRLQPHCTACADTQHYAEAVKGVPTVADHAVFATSSAPLGRVGPMLFAMSSVTDEVALSLEVPQWSWLRYVYPDVARHGGDTGPEPAPYLAVMGVPSTDQLGRVALRAAQRATWLTYQEVARTENDFTGALLPLYLFAAVEPAEDGQAGEKDDGLTAAQAVEAAVEAGAYAYVNASSTAPTVAEFEAATKARIAAANEEASVRYTQRRVSLRSGWDSDTPGISPCEAIQTHTVDEGVSPSALMQLSGLLGMPVTPAFVSGAQFICHASAGLWQEALKHRNVVWIDMMTDRRPTTKKKLGDTGKWGLAVEVGMSQKLILWLAYAYHAFPDTPYIIKGDDDAYLKVPQFLRDLRFIMADSMALPRSVSLLSYMALPLIKSTAEAVKRRGDGVMQPLVDTAVAPLPPVNATPCLYWGSLRVFRGARFAAGMTFMVHRSIVRAILSQPLRRRGVNVMRLATHTYHIKNRKAYLKSMFHREDILLGLLVNASMPQSTQYCAQGKVFFMREGFPRFHDLHVGKTHDVTWSTVVAHRCKPADYHYLHYFFQQEHRFSSAALPRGVTAEAHAQQTVKDWVKEQREGLPADVVNWNALPAVVWTHKKTRAPKYEIRETDQVAVYETRFHRLQDLSSQVQFGYEAEPAG